MGASNASSAFASGSWDAATWPALFSRDISAAFPGAGAVGAREGANIAGQCPPHRQPCCALLTQQTSAAPDSSMAARFLHQWALG